MASQTRTYEKKKLLGQIYTPAHIVNKILTLTGFFDQPGSTRSILDPACGDGRFLVPIARFLIKNTPAAQLKKQLQLLEGWDIDPAALKACRQNLEALPLPPGISVRWNLKCQDALQQRGISRRFDLIVGNPPYIRIQHLPVVNRDFIRKTYSFCKAGSTDAFVAFFELASLLLTKSGKCGFITPNSYFYSETGKQLRSYFEQNRNLIHITNFGKISVFEGTSTYSAITVFGTTAQRQFTFEQCVDNQFNCEAVAIEFDRLKSPWNLSVNPPDVTKGDRLGDICQISVGITTLADKLYLFRILEDNGEMVYAENKAGEQVYLEKAILKPVIKGSKLKSASDPVTEYILFPYQKNKAGKQEIIPESALRENFPQTFSYLLKVKPALDRRDNGKPNPVAWYAFGRSQGLDSAFGEKIIFSPMNKTPNFIHYTNPEVTVYSGYFIKYNGDYQWLLEQLNSERMANFIAIAGRDFQGGYKGYNKKAIENFIVSHLVEPVG